MGQSRSFLLSLAATFSKTEVWYFTDILQVQAEFYSPLDESLQGVSIDLAGDSSLKYDVTIPTKLVGRYETRLMEPFYAALVKEASIGVHIERLTPAKNCNSHHIIEATFKAFARAMRQAIDKADGRVPQVDPTSRGCTTLSSLSLRILALGLHPSDVQQRWEVDPQEHSRCSLQASDVHEYTLQRPTFTRRKSGAYLNRPKEPGGLTPLPHPGNMGALQVDAIKGGEARTASIHRKTGETSIGATGLLTVCSTVLASDTELLRELLTSPHAADC